MAIFGNIKFNVPSFIADGQPLYLPDGAVMSAKDKSDKWAFYMHQELNLSWLAIRAIKNGVLGWKIISFSSIANIQYVQNYVKSCNQCLENF